MKTLPKSRLTVQEAKRLHAEVLDAAVAHHESGLRLGRLLLRVRDTSAYVALGFPSFSKYLRSPEIGKTKCAPSHAFHLITAAQVETMLPPGETDGVTQSNLIKVAPRIKRALVAGDEETAGSLIEMARRMPIVALRKTLVGNYLAAPGERNRGNPNGNAGWQQRQGIVDLTGGVIARLCITDSTVTVQVRRAGETFEFAVYTPEGRLYAKVTKAEAKASA